MDKLLEKQLLALVQSGDAEAFGQLYTAYVPKIYRYLLFKVATREEAEDLSAEVFLRAWQYLHGQLRTVKSLQALLYRIAKHLAIDYYRQRQPPAYQLDEAAAAGVLDERQQRLFEQVDQSMTVAQIERALRTLKDEYREVVLLRYVEQLTVGEIAEVTARSRGSVRVMLHRALRLLRQQVDSHGETPKPLHG